MSNFIAVRDMYKKFGFIRDGGDWAPHHLDAVTTNFRMKALREEMEELSRAYSNQDLPEIADALIDLVVFALGTAALHDLPWEPLFEEVMRANMQKEVGQGRKARNDSNIPDLVKPEGWRPPDIARILKLWGWKD